MTPRRALVSLLALLAGFGCSDSSEPSNAVPRALYYIAWDDTPQLYGITLDGSSGIPLLSDSLRAEIWLLYWMPPVVSPDGATIQVAVSRTGGYALLNLDRFGTVTSVEPYHSSEGLSPDGMRRAWFADGYLNLAHADGTGLQRTYFDSLGVFSYDVAWSRDGKWLAYSKGLRDDFDVNVVRDTRLWILRLSDGFKRPVTSAGHGGSELAWSRDGKWLTFRSGTGINRVRTDGTGPEQTVFIGVAESHAWSPGDSLIGFVGSSSGLTTIRADGSGARKVAEGQSVTTFAWAE